MLDQSSAKAARKEFTKNFPCSFDDEKVPEFYAEIKKHFNPNDPSKKIAFIVVAHFVHTLPYFLEAISALGNIAALISKQSGTVKKVKREIVEIYRDIFFEKINKGQLTLTITLLFLLMNSSKDIYIQLPVSIVCLIALIFADVKLLKITWLSLILIFSITTSGLFSN